MCKYQRFKFYHFGICIYCFRPVKYNPNGEGEHVIPKNIYGFWKIYDICENCKEYFGDRIDHLAIKNPYVIQAMKQLSLPKVDKYTEEMPYKAIDPDTGSTIDVIRKNGEYQAKTLLTEHMAQFDEKRIRDVGYAWLKNKCDLPSDEFEREMKRLEEVNYELQPGERYHSDPLHCILIKRRFTDVSYDDNKIPAITPLIAKIVIAIINYLLNKYQIVQINNYEAILKHARYGKALKNTIGFLPPIDETKYYKFHRIMVSFYGMIILVDVSLFGSLLWRTVLRCQRQIVMKIKDGIYAKDVLFILDFSDLRKRKKMIGYRVPNGHYMFSEL